MGIDVECTEQTRALHLIVVRGSTYVADFGASWLGGGVVNLLVTPLYRLRATIDLELVDENGHPLPGPVR